MLQIMTPLRERPGKYNCGGKVWAIFAWTEKRVLVLDACKVYSYCLLVDHDTNGAKFEHVPIQIQL